MGFFGKLTAVDRKIEIAITLKRTAGGFTVGDIVNIIADDNLESCKKEFEKIFGSVKRA